VLSEIAMSTQATLDQQLLFNRAMSFHQKGMPSKPGRIICGLNQGIDVTMLYGRREPNPTP
jgi:hypothetical protein